MTSQQGILKSIAHAILGLAGISTLWVVGGNLLASALLQDQDHRWQELRQATLIPEANPSALRLRELAEQIGVKDLGQFIGGLEDDDLSSEMIQYLKQVTSSVKLSPDPVAVEDLGSIWWAF